MSLVLLLGAALAGVMLFLLATASGNTALFAQHYPLLLGLNAALAALLAALLAWQIRSLWRSYRAKAFGSRLTVRLLLLLALMAIVPGAVVYTVSVQFLAKSIESWFDVKVDAALEGGINLGQSAIDQMLGELQMKARTIAEGLSDRPAGQQVMLLNRLREQAGVQEAVIVNAGGRVLASASEDVSRLVPDELPSQQVLRQARSGRGYAALEGIAGKPLALRVVVPVLGLALADEARFLQLRQSVPEQFGRSAEAVETAYRDYRELALARQGLKRIYIVTLTLALSMALLVAIALAVILANRLSEPLANLAEAMQAVARGDFSRQAPVTSRDELGVLTESFNSMTRQLDDARRVVEANRTALETAKARLENILANLSAGVLVFDRELDLSVSNHGAQAILGAELDSFAAEMREKFRYHGERPWQLEMELKGRRKTLLVRGTALAQDPAGGFVLVFDDITQLIQAQRATAWAEVARRLAHEIKNPLTPIQLCAERLRRHFTNAPPQTQALVEECTSTIVGEVESLKGLVDEFSQFARMPAPRAVPTDVHELLADVLTLYRGIFTNVELTPKFAASLPKVSVDVEQIRRVLINLIDNAVEAMEQRGIIEIETQHVPADNLVRVIVADNGPGIPAAERDKLFLPYYSTKQRGSGLGLAIVRRIVAEHGGTIDVTDNVPRGTRFAVELPC